MLHSSMKTGAKRGSGRNLLRSFAWWSGATTRILLVFFKIEFFFFYYLLSKFMCFICLDVSKGNKLKLMLQKREGK